MFVLVFLEYVIVAVYFIVLKTQISLEGTSPGLLTLKG